jgi:hypothetical protein
VIYARQGRHSKCCGLVRGACEGSVFRRVAAAVRVYASANGFQPAVRVWASADGVPSRGVLAGGPRAFAGMHGGGSQD